MANSTHVITDATTVDATAFTAASVTKAAHTDNVDLDGMARSALVALYDAKQLLVALASNADAGDPNLAIINSILGTLA